MSVIAKVLQPNARPSEFDHWWHSQGEWVEPANLRRGGESGVQLLRPHNRSTPVYCKRQTGHLYRSLKHPFGRPTILREYAAYQAVAALGIKVPKVVFGAARRQHGQWQALLITEPLQGFISLEQWYASPVPHNDQALAYAVLEQLARMLLRLHAAGWQHGCCYPKHLFLKLPTPTQPIETAMLDLEKSRRRWQAKKAASRDLQQLHRHRGAMPESHWLHLQQSYHQQTKHDGISPT